MTRDPAGATTSAERDSPARMRVWDWPVRITHWGFAVLLPSQWWTWKSGAMSVHRLLGYVALGLLIFRAYWGLAGSSTARFASFVKRPQDVVRYARDFFSGAHPQVAGHNPLGAWSVVALLSLLSLQVTLGLFAMDVDGIESGPLSPMVSYAFADGAREWHGLVFNLLLVFVVLHLAAVAYYLIVARNNLIGPMITGYKRLANASPAPTFVPAWRAWLGVLIAGSISYWVSLGLPLP